MLQGKTRRKSWSRKLLLLLFALSLELLEGDVVAVFDAAAVGHPGHGGHGAHLHGVAPVVVYPLLGPRPRAAAAFRAVVPPEVEAVRPPPPRHAKDL